MRWLDKLLDRQPPPERSTTDTPTRDPAYYAAREQYQQEKQAAMAKQIELLARLNRLGFDLDITTKRDRSNDRQ